MSKGEIFYKKNSEKYSLIQFNVFFMINTGIILFIAW